MSCQTGERLDKDLCHFKGGRERIDNFKFSKGFKKREIRGLESGRLTLSHAERNAKAILVSNVEKENLTLKKLLLNSGLKEAEVVPGSGWALPRAS